MQQSNGGAAAHLTIEHLIPCNVVQLDSIKVISETHSQRQGDRESKRVG